MTTFSAFRNGCRRVFSSEFSCVLSHDKYSFFTDPSVIVAAVDRIIPYSILRVCTPHEIYKSYYYERFGTNRSPGSAAVPGGGIENRTRDTGDKKNEKTTRPGLLAEGSWWQNVFRTLCDCKSINRSRKVEKEKNRTSPCTIILVKTPFVHSGMTAIAQYRSYRRYFLIAKNHLSFIANDNPTERAVSGPNVCRTTSYPYDKIQFRTTN